MTKLTSREFNQDTGRAKRAAEAGPVYITHRGQPSHVLLTFDDYCQLAAQQPSVLDLLSRPPGVANIEFDPPMSREPGRAARFD